jgi:hypothetical protein
VYLRGLIDRLGEELGITPRSSAARRDAELEPPGGPADGFVPEIET